MARTSGIEPLSLRGRRKALPIYQVRSFRIWWVTRESNTARAKAQVLQTRSVTRLGVTQDVCEASQRRTAQRLSKARRASPGSLSKIGGEALVLIRSAGAPSRVQSGADVPAGYPSMATTIGLEPTSSTFGRSRSSG
jgi:hypothetical protein